MGHYVDILPIMRRSLIVVGKKVFELQKSLFFFVINNSCLLFSWFWKPQSLSSIKNVEHQFFKTTFKSIKPLFFCYSVTLNTQWEMWDFEKFSKEMLSI